jgi:hypothetical protein
MEKGVTKQVQQSPSSSEGETTIAMFLPIIPILAIPLLMGVSYFVWIKPILEKTGLKDSTEDKALQSVTDQVQSGDYWSPTWYKVNGGATISDAYAQLYASQLDNAMHGWFNGNVFGYGTDEDTISGIINSIASKSNISLVAEKYGQAYQTGLLADLRSELSPSDFATYVGKPITHFPN